ncbi:MAG: hypothetical protein MJH10_19095, partial [Epibacterium sp.]|nr:hypothetical protein [Epibacterium sp.]NQX75590.1 hypothetical protein [Epibacterium sp.]
MSLKDKIADSVIDHVERAYYDEAEAVADAILDLLRESVKPSEWYEDGHGGWRTQDYIGMYEVYRNDNELWTFDSS